jgi:hypothetical protein
MTTLRIEVVGAKQLFICEHCKTVLYVAGLFGGSNWLLKKVGLLRAGPQKIEGHFLGFLI